MLTVEQLIFILDKVGIVAFAFVGVSLGIQKKLDIFGLVLIGIISAIGGGILRDLTLGKVPFAVSNISYLEFASAATVFSILVFYLKVAISNKVLIFADTLGLGAFAAAGVTVSLNAGLGIFHTILFSIITAVAGGIIRDTLLNKIPIILKREVYATAAGIGGLGGYLAFYLGSTINNAAFLALAVTIVVRIISIYRGINLPTINNDGK